MTINLNATTCTITRNGKTAHADWVADSKTIAAMLKGALGLV